MSESITIAAPPTTADSVVSGLALMAALSGVETDFNVGSQIRTLLEASGEVIEEQGIITQALVFQAMMYGAMAAFGVEPESASPANGSVTFATSFASNAPSVPQDVIIDSGTIVQTQGGTQFATQNTVTLSAGSVSVAVPVIATVPGVGGNQNANSVTIISSTLPYPLLVTNPAAMIDGEDAETPAQTLSRFVAVVASLGQASPVSVANACIGVTSGSEKVAYATVYEPWLALGNTNAGYQVIIDNGSGTASAALIAAVTAKLNGSVTLMESGYRPAGVPYTVAANSPISFSVVITGALLDSSEATTLDAMVSSANITYATSLLFGADPSQGALNAIVSNTLSGATSSFSVTLLDSNGNSQQTIAVPPNQRAIMTSQTVTLQ